jgi:uncharacterized protein (DUF305 family)
MLTHHRQTRDLTASAAEGTTNSDVLASAQQMAAAQQTENQALIAWLMQWGDDPYDYDGMDTLTPGMVNQVTMTRLRSLQGVEFDKLWLQSVVAYQHGAMEMAQNEVKKGQNPDAIAMANSILSTRPAELDKLRQLLN